VSAPRSKEEARSRILACLAANPGVTALRLGQLLGLRSNAMRTLRVMQFDAEVIAVPQWRPQMGRTVSIWFAAPPGTVPPPRPAPDPAALARRRVRETMAQRARRTRGKPGPFSSLRPGLVRAPDLSAGACRSADPGLFFAADAERVADWHRREAAAKAICAGCPVRRLCLAYALDSGQDFGIWGGCDEAERRAILRGQAERRAS
jgi:WhiB family redox-sensing transcriptional regulator